LEPEDRAFGTSLYTWPYFMILAIHIRVLSTVYLDPGLHCSEVSG
jgi:hypothetical protein